MNNRWSDFLFAIGVRLVCGVILGGLAGMVLGWKFILRREARNDLKSIALWLCAWTVGGAIVAVCRIPHWQRPWYKGIRGGDGRKGPGSPD
jgi:hypothetical protein